MFSGIIEELGEIKSIAKKNGNLEIEIKARTILQDLKIGHSVNIDGVCQTVVKTGQGRFTVEATEETLQRTTFNNLKVGQMVNLERALQVSDRLGGHILTGHIDCPSQIISIQNRRGSHFFEISTPAEDTKYIIEKGSIAIEGISLTVAQVKPESFVVSIIPHTLENTNLKFKKAKDKVNLEFDIIGKYVEKLLKMDLSGNKITEKRLKELGW